MSTTLFFAVAFDYVIAIGFFAAFLRRGHQSLAILARSALALAFGLQLLSVVGRLVQASTQPWGGIQQTLSLLSLLLVAGYLVASSRREMQALGAFVAPLALLFFLGSSISPGVTPVTPQVRSLLLRLHIGLNLVGLCTLALAFAVSLAYVVQESLLRRKQLGAAFRHLPALDRLDRLGLRLVMVGLPLLTLGIVTGTLWARRVGSHGLSLSPAQALAILSWMIFAGVLLLRLAAGWRGRRAAIGTIVGFACAVVVLAGYVMRSAGG